MSAAVTHLDIESYIRFRFFKAPDREFTYYSQFVTFEERAARTDGREESEEHSTKSDGRERSWGGIRTLHTSRANQCTSRSASFSLSRWRKPNLTCLCWYSRLKKRVQLKLV